MVIARSLTQDTTHFFIWTLWTSTRPTLGRVIQAPVIEMQTSCIAGYPKVVFLSLTTLNI